MKSIFTGLAVYLALVTIGGLVLYMKRPPTCPKGHTDHYCLDEWRCRICQTIKMNRGLKRRMKERARESQM